MTTFYFETRNGFSKFRGAGALQQLVYHDKITIDDAAMSVTALTDDAAKIVSTVIARANAAWNAPSADDPPATARQIDYLKNRCPQPTIMGFWQLNLDELTKSQASRLIDCAHDIAANGY